MGQKYAVFNEKGLPIAFYDLDIHGENIPSNATPITEEQWLEFINNQGKRAYINGKIIDITNKKWDEKKKVWRELTEQEILSKRKQQLINQLSILTKQYIEKYYPDIKQRSDIADKEYWASYLIATNENYTIDKIYSTAYKHAMQIITKQKTLKDILNTIPKNEQNAWEQLIKIALRVAFVQEVKKEYHQLKQQIENTKALDELNKVKITFKTKYPLAT